MKKITTLALAMGATISLAPIARCDEIAFTTLPQPVQTTVIRETHIANPSYVTRVVRSENGVYAGLWDMVGTLSIATVDVREQGL